MEILSPVPGRTGHTHIMITKPDLSIDTCELGDEERRVVRVFVGDYYDQEREELEISVGREEITFAFFSCGQIVDEQTLTHEDLFKVLVEGLRPEEL